MYTGYQNVMFRCIDIANSKGILTAHDIADEMGLAHKPSNNPVIVDMSKRPTHTLMCQAIYKSMEWILNYNRAFKKGEPTMESTMPVTGNITINTDSANIGADSSTIASSTGYINADSANVGVDSSTIASSTGYSFTLNNPHITQDIIDDLTRPSKDSHLTIEFGDLNDVINKKLFSTKNFNLPIRPLRYFQPGNGRLTVEWTDHTKTVVTSSDPEHADIFSGICIAYTKRMFGSTTAIIKAIEQAKWTTDAPKRLRKMKQEIDKSKKHLDRELAKKAHERMVQNRIEAIKIEQEAQKRIAEEKEASDNA